MQSHSGNNADATWAWSFTHGARMMGTVNSNRNSTDKRDRQLQKIQKNFHKVIKSRADRLIREHNVSLPELKEIAKERMYFPVPGMYGGFAYWFEGEGDNIKLITESRCRVVSGSGMRHEITAQGYKLVAEGFV